MPAKIRTHKGCGYKYSGLKDPIVFNIFLSIVCNVMLEIWILYVICSFCNLGFAASPR